MRSWRAPFSTAVAIAAGLLVLISIFVSALEPLRSSILGWVILMAAVALLLGLVNLFQVHFQRIREGKKAFYSFVLLAAMFLTFVITLAQGRQGLLADWIFRFVQVPLESSLIAILAVSLIVAAVRLLQTRKDVGSLIFVGSVLLILLGSAPFFGLELSLFSDSLRPFITRVLSLGAIRGLLIGIGLGTLATGIRILIGSDRPFGGS